MSIAKQVFNANYPILFRRAVCLYNDKERAKSLLLSVREKAVLMGSELSKNTNVLSWYLETIRSEFLNELVQADKQTTDKEYIRRVFGI